MSGETNFSGKLVVKTNYQVFKEDESVHFFWDNHKVEITDMEDKPLRIKNISVDFPPEGFNYVTLEIMEELTPEDLVKDLKVKVSKVDGVGVELEPPVVYILKPVIDKITYSVVGSRRYWLERAEAKQKEE